MRSREKYFLTSYFALSKLGLVSDSFYRKKLAVEMPPALTFKWTKELLDEGYVAFPKRLIRAAPQIFTGEHAVEQLAVALTLVDYLRPDNSRPPSTGFLAFAAGMTAERFESRLRELVARGLVTWLGSREQVRFELHGLIRAIRQYSDEG